MVVIRVRFLRLQPQDMVQLQRPERELTTYGMRIATGARESEDERTELIRCYLSLEQYLARYQKQPVGPLSIAVGLRKGLSGS